MSSTVEQQHGSPSNLEPTSERTSGNMDGKVQPNGHKPSNGLDLASQTANLRLGDENINSTAASKIASTTTHDDVSTSNKVNESPGTELEVRTADSVEPHQDMAIGNIGADRLAVGEESLDIGIQNDTPRLSTYIDLHNEVRFILGNVSICCDGMPTNSPLDDTIQIRPHFTRNRAARTLPQSLSHRSQAPRVERKARRSANGHARPRVSGPRLLRRGRLLRADGGSSCVDQACHGRGRFG